MEDGLSDYNIYTFLQDSRGVMWIGTQYGLNRYDGASIKVYNKEDLGFDSDWVIEIEKDANQMLWIRNIDVSNKSYLYIFDPITEKVKSIAEYTGSPCPLNPAYTKISPLYNDINMLIEEKDSILNFYELEGDQLSIAFNIKLDNLDSLNLHRYADLYSDAYKLSQDTFFVQFSNNEMAYVNNKGEILRVVYPEENLHKINELYLKGNIVDTKRDEKIISKNNIRYSFEEDTVKIYSTSGQLLQKKEVAFNRSKSKTPPVLTVDHHGNLWYNSTQRSFCILSLKEQKFKVEAFDESSPFRTRGILKTSQGTIYALIWKSQDQIFLYQKSSESSSFNRLFGGYGLLEADINSLWISGGSALYHYSLPTKKRVKYLRKGYNQLWQPYKSPDGDIWVGNNKGLLRLDTLTEQLIDFNDYSNFPILQNSTVYAFHTNEKGTWLATSAGLFLVDLDQEKILENYSDSQEGAFHIPTHHIAHFHEDQAGIFWLATKGDGLIRWNPKTKKRKVFSKANAGLSHDVLYAVYEDDFDHLWISSNWGLMSFNKTSHLVTTYLEEDGIPNNEFNTISHHKDKEGNMYFGTQNGFIHFHPKDFIPKKTDFPFIISACTKELLESDSIIKMTAQVLESHEINFYPSDKSVNLDFVLLDYENSKNVQYSYKIEGYHQDWIY